MTAGLVHLLRHGEVDNPHHVVYADLPGYGLSGRGIAQASAAATHLLDHEVARVISSPLLRARQTAEIVAAPHGIPVELDEALTEWSGGIRWSGVTWDDLPRVFPGELEEYMTRPLQAGFAAESLLECGARVALVCRQAAEETAGDVVVVSHQDPIHAGYLVLCALPTDRYHSGKPAHATVLTLRPSSGHWKPERRWDPPQGQAFPPVE